MNENYTQKILSVDDIHKNNILIHGYLEPYGVQIIMAKSGQEALELISKNHFILFILDVMMNKMDGFELAKKIREIEEHKFTPIIFITGIYSNTSSIFKGYESGAVDYLVKPINKEILRQKVKVFLAQKIEKTRGLLSGKYYDIMEQQGTVFRQEFEKEKQETFGELSKMLQPIKEKFRQTFNFQNFWEKIKDFVSRRDSSPAELE